MRKFLVRQKALVMGLVLTAPLSAAAIGSVSAGDVTFGYTNNFATSSGATVDVQFTGSSAGDMAYDSWWFYRVSGGSFESAFANPDLELYSGAVGSLVWNDPAATGQFSAALSFEVIDPGTGGNLFQNMRITNTSGSSLTIDIFHYTDLDLDGNSGGDAASLGSSPDGILINQSDGTHTAPLIGYGADAYRVTQYRQLLQDLTDNNVDDLNNSGLPINNRDVTVGFQWSVTIGAGSHADFMTQFASNAPLLPSTVTVVPEPGTAILLGLGLLMLAVPPRPDADRAA